MNHQTDLTNSLDLLNQFLWIAAITGVILLISVIAIQISDQINWQSSDLIGLGITLFIAGSMAVLVWQRNKPDQ